MRFCIVVIRVLLRWRIQLRSLKPGEAFATINAAPGYNRCLRGRVETVTPTGVQIRCAMATFAGPSFPREEFAPTTRVRQIWLYPNLCKLQSAV